MVDFEKMINKMNVKEVLAIVAGGTGGKFLDNALSNFITDTNQRAIAKVVVGLLGAYAMNELAERYTDYAEILALAGLGFSAVAAEPITERVTAEVASATNTPVVVVSKMVEAQGKPISVPAAAKPSAKGAVSI